MEPKEVRRRLFRLAMERLRIPSEAKFTRSQGVRDAVADLDKRGAMGDVARKLVTDQRCTNNGGVHIWLLLPGASMAPAKQLGELDLGGSKPSPVLDEEVHAVYPTSLTLAGVFRIVARCIGS